MRSVTPVSILSEVVSMFNERGIRYCHWKSNEHLAAAVAADTDLDVLFDESERVPVEEVLADTGFR